MTANLTAEQFLSERDPDEADDVDPELAVDRTAMWVLPADPLPAIADSLRRLVDIVERRDAEDVAEAKRIDDYDALDQEYRQTEALHDAKQALIEQVLEICKPSTSKLANSIRALLEPPDEAPSGDEPAPEPTEPVEGGDPA